MTSSGLLLAGALRTVTLSPALPPLEPSTEADRAAGAEKEEDRWCLGALLHWMLAGSAVVRPEPDDDEEPTIDPALPAPAADLVVTQRVTLRAAPLWEPAWPALLTLRSELLLLPHAHATAPARLVDPPPRSPLRACVPP